MDIEKKRQRQREWYAKHKDDPEFKDRRKQQKESWRKKNLEYHRRYYKTHRYDIDYDTFLAEVAEQNGCCEICGNYKGFDLQIDHNHDTGKYRGLLCTKCNTGLGHFNDDPVLLDKAKTYLNR